MSASMPMSSKRFAAAAARRNRVSGKGVFIAAGGKLIGRVKAEAVQTAISNHVGRVQTRIQRRGQWLAREAGRLLFRETARFARGLAQSIFDGGPNDDSCRGRAHSPGDHFPVQKRHEVRGIRSDVPLWNQHEMLWGRVHLEVQRVGRTGTRIDYHEEEVRTQNRTFSIN